MTARPLGVRLAKAERRHLERLFVHHFRDRRVVANNVTTNLSHTPLAVLHSLTRKGAITYEEVEEVRSIFGVRGYRCLLTSEALALLEGEGR
jgi:hypothetical protein